MISDLSTSTGGTAHAAQGSLGQPDQDSSVSVVSLTESHPAARPYLPGLELCPRHWESQGRDEAEEAPRGIGGYVSDHPDDFYVHELPKYFPSGEGEHTMALVLKMGRTTEDAISSLSRGSGVSARDIGYSGRKDKQALTTQWISLPTTPDQVNSVDDQVVVLLAAPHHQKLKLGHHLGNLFAIRVSEVTDLDALEEGLARLKRGIPNYFERQRFGRTYYKVRPDSDYQPPRDATGRPLQDPNNHATDNVDTALRLLRDPRQRGHGKRTRYHKLALSALQSAMFNLWVGERIKDGLMERVILGDVCRKIGGGTFYSTDPDIDTERLRCGEIEVLGPLVGPKLFPAQELARAREESLYLRWGLTAEMRSSLGRTWRGDRRSLLLKPQNLTATVELGALGDVRHVRLLFRLAPGSFATALLGDLIHPLGGTFSRLKTPVTHPDQGVQDLQET